MYLSAVYEKTDRFVKKGTPWLIDNEKRFLRKLEPYEAFPHIIAEGQEGEESWIEISRVPGVSMHNYFKKEYKHNTMASVRMFIEETLEVLMQLRDNAIVHRDVTPDNLRVDMVGGKLKVGMIDFGWSVYKEEENMVTPPTLGGEYACKPIRSDVYSFAKILRKYWPHIQAAQCVSEQLKKGVALEEIKVRYTLRDYATFFVMRHKRIKKMVKKVREWIKR
jgi:serine/threonine protein kinase